MSVTQDTQALVACHKPCWVAPDPLYRPVHVGAALSEEGIPGFIPDSIGDNLSLKNPHYCELTALYWGWKNLPDVANLGICHYRRYFKGSGENDTLTLSEAEELLGRAPVVLPKRRHYVVETVRSHYGYTFDAAQFDLMHEILAEREPRYAGAFNEHINGRSSHIYNMFIMRRDVLESYCAWLFPLLDEFDRRWDFEGMTPFEARATGRVAERLLDPWLHVNSVGYVERSCVAIGGENLAKKATGFLKARFFGEKYGRSF